MPRVSRQWIVRTVAPMAALVAAFLVTAADNPIDFAVTDALTEEPTFLSVDEA